ncbi:uncharacterized protein LOC123525701 isoform X2 [Mercenaria mercenaria]|uniref:uncharacterized protein LOC123525701 isoform X2 n=1 Tax=Mercenaria mercenaria TaxID=6596 RepID=UPI00234EAD1F|nr:uncharacterized protein LOC123525701 isoform X2 [Mercenaria mercenaria]
MPEGMFVRRRVENAFKPEHRDQYMQAFNWLNYLNQYEGTHILHQRNHGKEIRFGKYPVDGYDSETKTIYEFQGCYHHGHQCVVTKNVTNERWHQIKDALLERTEKKVAQLRRMGFNVVEMWECEFRDYCKTHPKIYWIRDQCRPIFCQKHRGKVTENQILNGVRTGELFGMVECDIEVPEEWGCEKSHISLSPQQYFEEMCPIFCNTEVGFDDIGEHMRAHVWEYQLSDKPRRLLVGGTKARQILLATPLLKWYLDHGLQVTKIYQVVEYRKKACFESFVKEVSDARRAGDACKDMAIIADTMKLIGNSG